MSNRKYEVIVTVWSNEHQKQVKEIAGTFDRFMNAKLFADAYEMHYKAKTEIIEYKKT